MKKPPLDFEFRDLETLYPHLSKSGRKAKWRGIKDAIYPKGIGRAMTIRQFCKYMGYDYREIYRFLRGSEPPDDY